MSTQVCTKHAMQDDVVVVVYQANVPHLQQCPLCAAIKERDELKEKVRDLELGIYETGYGEDL